MPQSLVPRILAKRGDRYLELFLAIAIGVSLMTIMAQVSFQLPFSPVPITGQTFGVMLLALLWGSRLSLASIGLYMGLGAVGLPVFAGFKSGLVLGPTAGYLVGMFFAAFVMGYLSDRGWASSKTKLFVTCLLGEVLIFSFGLVVLKHFVPNEALLAAGLFPFIPGEIVKILTISALVSGKPSKL